jgi:glycosyltransferase involved in cell wall biosynthesis
MNAETEGRNALRICFFVARYSRSGVPLAQIRLAKAFRREGHQVDIVFGYVPDGLVLPVVDGISITNLGLPRTYKLLMPIFAYIRKVRPDVVFSAEDHLNAVVTLALLLAGSKAKLSVSSRVTPFDTYSNKLFSKRWFLKKISVPLRNRADALVCVSKDMVLQYQSIFGPSKYQCIYNVICDAEMQGKMLQPVNDPWLIDDAIPVVITAGRLAPEKGFGDLILAMKALTRTKAARLLILGDGPLRPELEELISRKGLTHCVRLVGFQENPLKYFRKAKVFVLSSYVEGLPNVLVEAMACGCTAVATDCPTGPREVLNGGEYGYMVPMNDPIAMAEAIQKALENPMPAESLENAILPFTELARVT